MARLRTTDDPGSWSLVLNFDLRRFVGDCFWAPSVHGDGAGYADCLAAVDLLGGTELRTITPPDQHRENLIGIGLVKVDERRIARLLAA